MEVFWNTIAHYNENTWVAQIVITFVGIILTTLLYHKPTLWVKRSVKIYMVFLNSWISVVYYMMYCSTRSYNYILAIFGELWPCCGYGICLRTILPLNAIRVIDIW